MQVQELVGIVPWNFIATICNLFIQVYLIKRFLFKPINEMLEKRKAKADAQTQDAVKAKEEAQAMKAEYEKNMQEAKNKANDIVMTAQKTAAIQSEEMLKEASSQVTAMTEKAEKDISEDLMEDVPVFVAEREDGKLKDVSDNGTDAGKWIYSYSPNDPVTGKNEKKSARVIYKIVFINNKIN